MKVLILLLLLLSLTWGIPHKRSRRHHFDSESGYLKLRNEAVPSDVAQKAAEEAKAAHAAQNAAGAQAAHMVKSRLAEKALQAAQAAEAALSGKQALVEQLEQEVKEAEAAVQRNKVAVNQEEETVNVAARAAQLASDQHQQILQALKLAEDLKKSADSVLEKTKSGLEEKCQHLSEGRNRLANLQSKLQQALSDCSETKKAAESALESAKAACNNASRRRKRVIRKAFRRNKG